MTLGSVPLVQKQLEARLSNADIVANKREYAPPFFFLIRTVKMIKLIGIILLIASVAACAPRVSREAARIAYHHDMTTLLEDCERLGPVTGEVKASWHKGEQAEITEAEFALTEAALAKYGTGVDNVVFISTAKVTEGKNTIFAQGAAFKCD